MLHPKYSDEDSLDVDLGIDALISEYIDRENQPSSLHIPVWDLLDRGGKRFRPLLCYLSCKLIYNDTKALIQLASAIELLHNMTLIHDDIEDNSDRRRGKACIHHIYGIPAAINTGDFMAIKVFEMVLTHIIPKEIKLTVLSKFIDRINQMLHGQAIEIENRNTMYDSIELTVEIMKGKTSALLMLACEIGIILGRGSEQHLLLIQRYAGYLGLAFQITDDVLNVIGDKKYGKEIGGDLREAKKTIIVSHFMSVADKRDKIKFLRHFGDKGAGVTEVNWMISILREYNSIDYSMKLASYYLDCALFYLQLFPDNEARKSLSNLSKFLIKRLW